MHYISYLSCRVPGINARFSYRPDHDTAGADNTIRCDFNPVVHKRIGADKRIVADRTLPHSAITGNMTIISDRYFMRKDSAMIDDAVIAYRCFYINHGKREQNSPFTDNRMF
jgi:hypothetical protein